MSWCCGCCMWSSYIRVEGMDQSHRLSVDGTSCFASFRNRPQSNPFCEASLSYVLLLSANTPRYAIAPSDLTYLKGVSTWQSRCVRPHDVDKCYIRGMGTVHRGYPKSDRMRPNDLIYAAVLRGLRFGISPGQPSRCDLWGLCLIMIGGLGAEYRGTACICCRRFINVDPTP